MRTRPFAAEERGIHVRFVDRTQTRHRALRQTGLRRNGRRRRPRPQATTAAGHPRIRAAGRARSGGHWNAWPVFTATGFAKHKLVPDAGEEYFAPREISQADIRLCRRSAEKEIAGAELTRKEYDELDGPSASPTWTSRSAIPTRRTPDRWQTALVTDVFSNAISARRSTRRWAAVRDARTGRRQTQHPRRHRGAYRHLEFTRAMDARMTDEEWKKAVYQPNAKLPARAGWAVPVFAPVTCEGALARIRGQNFGCDFPCAGLLALLLSGTVVGGEPPYPLFHQSAAPFHAAMEKPGKSALRSRHHRGHRPAPPAGGGTHRTHAAPRLGKTTGTHHPADARPFPPEQAPLRNQRP